MAAIGSTLQKIDGIEYENKLWLVPAWIDSLEEKLSKPVRMIRFDLLDYSEVDSLSHQFVLTRQLPEGILDGTITDGYEILVEPEIPFAIPFSPENTSFH